MDGLSTLAVVGIVVVALIATVGASELLIRGIRRLARNLGLIGGLVGLLVALGADSPEIASAIAATANGSASTGAGIVVGSNVFNVAVLLAAGTLAAGSIRIHRAAVVIDAGVAIAVTAILGAGVLGTPAPIVWALLVVVFGPYVAYLWLPPAAIARSPLPETVRSFLARASGEADIEGDEIETALEGDSRSGAPSRSWSLVVLVGPALVVIVIGAVLLVRSALTLGSRYEVPTVLVGVIGLAAATGLPNVYAATRLAMDGRGAAVVSETFNSNTLNVIAGIALPMIFVPALPAAIPHGYVVWLLGITMLALLLLVRGIGRRGAALLLFVYAGFVAYTLVTR